MPLRDKLKALTAPCREVDAEIAVMFRDCPKTAGYPEHWLMKNFPPEAWRPYVEGHVLVGTGKGCASFTSAKFTASLDATVDLVERELPLGDWRIRRAVGDYTSLIVDRGAQWRTRHTLPAVALLLALLDAKEIE